DQLPELGQQPGQLLEVAAHDAARGRRRISARTAGSAAARSRDQSAGLSRGIARETTLTAAATASPSSSSVRARAAASATSITHQVTFLPSAYAAPARSCASA